MKINQKRLNHKIIREGVAMEPVFNPTMRNFWPVIFKVWVPIGILLGVFIIFWVIPQVGNWEINSFSS